MRTVLFLSAAVLIPTFLLRESFIYMNEFSNDEKIEQFKTNTEFICSTFTDKYFVSKKSGFEILDSKYFKKDDLLIEISNCEVRK